MADRTDNIRHKRLTARLDRAELTRILATAYPYINPKEWEGRELERLRQRVTNAAGAFPQIAELLEAMADV